MKKLKDMTTAEINAYKYRKLRERITNTQVIINGVDAELLSILKAYLASKEAK